MLIGCPLSRLGNVIEVRPPRIDSQVISFRIVDRPVGIFLRAGEQTDSDSDEQSDQIMFHLILFLQAYDCPAPRIIQNNLLTIILYSIM